MKSKTSALALTLTAIAVASSVAYTIAYSNVNGSSRNGSPHNMMEEMMGHMGHNEDNYWGDEMEQHREEMHERCLELMEEMHVEHSIITHNEAEEFHHHPHSYP